MSNELPRGIASKIPCPNVADGIHTYNILDGERGEVLVVCRYCDYVRQAVPPVKVRQESTVVGVIKPKASQAEDWGE